MNQAELDKLMIDSANDAVMTSQDEFQITLDYSAESIAHIDNILLAFIERYQDKALEDNAVFTLCNIYGAYIGETFKRLCGGNWRYDQSNPEAPYVLLDMISHSYAFAGICYERLVNDSQVSVKNYFDHAIEQHKQ